MKIAVVTGACGLVGNSAVTHLCKEGFKVIGIDNDSRKMMFGDHASTSVTGEQLKLQYSNFELLNADIRNFDEIKNIISNYGKSIDLIYHLAAAPAHEWATNNAMADFHINAVGTMNLLENYRQHCSDAVFIQCSTSKVYGDIVNEYPYEKLSTRYDLPKNHKFYNGFDESIGHIDNSLRSLFGASKTCGDIMAQEYGKYFNLKIAIFRPACISGSNHKGDKLHGFLSYLAKCIATGERYTINGYSGLQTRDSIHADDLVKAFYEVYKNPKHSYGETYNIGAGRDSTISMIEAIAAIEIILDKKANIEYSDITRKGDHVCNTFSTEKFKSNYPDWELSFSNETILQEICKQYK